MTLAECKSWLRIEHSRDDALIENLILPAAVAWVADQSGQTAEFVQTDKLLTVAVYWLAGAFYNNREAIAAIQLHQLPLTLQSIINNYRFGGEWEP